MLNQMMIVGRLAKEVEIKEIEGKKFAEIVLACPRSCKNEEGVYETDFIPVMLWEGIAKNTAEYCKKGDMIGVRGRIEVTEGKIVLNAEKLTFLSSNKEVLKENGVE